MYWLSWFSMDKVSKTPQQEPIVTRARSFIMSDDQEAFEGQQVHCTIVRPNESPFYKIGFVKKVYDQGCYVSLEGIGIIAVGFGNEDVKADFKIGYHLKLITLDDKPVFGSGI
jgi:hypothetical protein